MRSRSLSVLRLSPALLSWLAVSAQADTGHAQNLVIHASGFKHQDGQAIANLFYEGDDIFKATRSRVVSTIQNDKAVLSFPNVSPGIYAVLVFHDENGNGDLDHNLLRMPTEPWGYSNDFELTLFSGLPNFQKVRFVFPSEREYISIRVK